MMQPQAVAQEGHEGLENVLVRTSGCAQWFKFVGINCVHCLSKPLGKSGGVCHGCCGTRLFMKAGVGGGCSMEAVVRGGSLIKTDKGATLQYSTLHDMKLHNRTRRSAV